ncbi:MAG: hypothetical protein HY898_10315 [Deltaproteobacteria bacterium]|nr:hypothetical protein [Deltaproteobacteria bacterium]
MNTARPARWLGQGALAIALGLAVASLGPSCQEYDSSLLHQSPAKDGGSDTSITPEASDDALSEAEPADEPLPEAGPETSPDVETDGFDPTWCDKCKVEGLVRPVCPPQVEDPADDKPLVFAMRTIRFGMNTKKPKDWMTIGLDLDCMSTGANGEPASCKRVSGADIKVGQDGELGRDNSFGHNIGGLVNTLELLGLMDNLEENQNLSFETGASGIVLAIDNYGGGRNDPTVKLSMYLSRGTYDAAGTTEIPAVWDGNDLWSRDTNSVTASDGPKYMDDAAFVTDGVLVAHLPDGLPLIFAGSAASLEMSLNKTVLMLRISDDHKQVTEGVLAGVWNVISALSAITGFAAQSGICPSDPSYGPAIQAVSTAPDIRLDLVPRPDLECNAISIALAFTGEPAKLGALQAANPSPPSACDAGTD